MSSDAAEPAASPNALILLRDAEHEAQAESIRVWGLTARERLERGLRRAGAQKIETLGPEDPAPSAAVSGWIVVRADLFYDERILAGLFETPSCLLVDSPAEAGSHEVLAANSSASQLATAVESIRHFSAPASDDELAGLRRVEKLDLAPAYNQTLRKHDPPFVYRAERSTRRETENRIFKASYKGITDLVTKWVWPLPAREVVRVLARRGVTPNSVTAVGYLLTALATWFFYEGWFAAGLAAGWLMTFLDTVDGKLARCTLTSSPIGNVLDHGLDLIHPPIWWAAWAAGLPLGIDGYWISFWVVVIGYVTGRLLEGVFLAAFKQELFTWRPFDAWFRTIIARRNPNLIILSFATAMGRPDTGFVVVAGWTVVANVVPAIRIVQAFRARQQGHEIRSWYEERESAKQAT